MGEIDGNEHESLNLLKKKMASVLDLAIGKGMNMTGCAP